MPDISGDTPQDQQEATAPEEATTEIVTEATAAPTASSRPPGKRPAAPAPQVAEAPAETTQQPASTNDTPVSDTDVNDALREALGETTQAPSGPPLSGSEKESLRVAVSQCWNVGALSTDALQTVIVVSVNMSPDGTPIAASMNMINFSGGSDASAQRVYQQARSAIVRCGAKGFRLPQEKYSQWQTIEMTFDPRKMGSK